MGWKNVLLLFMLQAIVIFSVKEDVDSTFSRSSYFTTRQNKQLMGYVVKRFDSPSLLSCSQQCMRNAWCTSTNYKMSSKKDGKGTCELNKHDISPIKENINFLYDETGVTFALLLKVKDSSLLLNFCCHGLHIVPPLQLGVRVCYLYNNICQNSAHLSKNPCI